MATQSATAGWPQRDLCVGGAASRGAVRSKRLVRLDRFAIMLDDNVAVPFSEPHRNILTDGKLLRLAVEGSSAAAAL